MLMAGDWRDFGGSIGKAHGLFGYNSVTALAKVPDGTSNTIMVMEMPGGHINWNGSGGLDNGWCTPSWAAGFNYSAFWLCPNASNGNCRYTSADAREQRNSFGTFGTLHGGDIIMTGMADGSVRGFRPTMDFATFTFLSCYRDGNVVNLDQ
jgi:hypothetical protein